MPPKKSLTSQQAKQLLATLKSRFEKNPHRHKGLKWLEVEARLESAPEKLWSLAEMERTGGEPDVVAHRQIHRRIYFLRLRRRKPERPPQLLLRPRRMAIPQGSQAQKQRHRRSRRHTEVTSSPKRNIANSSRYETLDTKTSSWILTPVHIRQLGGALFCDRRLDTLPTYHNGAESYYAARGFRFSLKA